MILLIDAFYQYIIFKIKYFFIHLTAKYCKQKIIANQLHDLFIAVH